MKHKDKNERDLHRQLNKETDKSIHLKEDTWKNIQQELFTEQKARRIWPKRLGVSFGMIAVAAMLMVVLVSSGLFTNRVAEEPNEPDISTNDPEEDPPEETEERLADQYEPEKEMEIELEGMKETIDMELAVNEELRYVFYLEKDNYEFIERESDGEDLLRFIGERDDRYPPVGMYIKMHASTTLEDQIAYVKEDIAEDGMLLTEEKETNDPFDAYEMIAYESEEHQWDWDTVVHRYYITEVENDTYFLFKQSFFYEAWEGAAQRLDLMLSTFEYAGEGANQDD